jgi:adenosylcobyric acid synthase
MLGTQLSDPGGIEGPASTVAGLGLLDVETALQGDKVLVEISGTSADGQAPFKGYEMHVGRTRGAGCERPLLHFADGRKEGAVSASGRVAGCYVHGLFSDDRQRDHWLQRIAGRSSGLAYEADVDETLDRLAAHLERHLDCDRLFELAGFKATP